MKLIIATLVSMSILAGSQDVIISVSIPASILQDADVELYPENSPGSPIFPTRLWRNSVWEFTARINSLPDEKWILLITGAGKIGIKRFVPSVEQNLTITIYDIPTPLLTEEEGGTIAWSLQLPEEILPFLDSIDLYADGTKYSSDQKLLWMPSVCYAKVYFGKEKLHWALSKVLY